MFLDTSGLFCYLHRDEPQHLQAAAFFAAPTSKVTHNYVIAEFVALAHARRLPRGAVLSFASELLNNLDVEIVWVTPQLHRDAMRLLTNQVDKSYSLCDAVSFLVMRERGTSEALTTDRHFVQAGFRALLN